LVHVTVVPGVTLIEGGEKLKSRMETVWLWAPALGARTTMAKRASAIRYVSRLITSSSSSFFVPFLSLGTVRSFLYDVWLIRSNGRRREATTADEQRSPPLRLT
jgi:hypothetical protein